MYELSAPAPRRRLAPRLLRARAAALRSDMVRPVDAPQAFAAGRRGMRILLVGSGPVAGWGVGSHDLALPGALARALAATSGRGAVVDVVPHPSAGVRRLGGLLRRAHPDRYDAVVLSATVTDAVRLAEPSRWARRVGDVLERSRRGGGQVIVWLGAQPIRIPGPEHRAAGATIGEHSRLLNAEARRVCREHGAVFVDLAEPPHVDSERHRTPTDYLFWARGIADAVAPALEEKQRTVRPVLTQAADRVEAIDRLKLAERGRDARLDGLVGTAKRTIGTEIAMFTVLDDRKEWPLASIGATLREIPVEQSVCLHTLQAPDGMAVCDAVEDDRFASSALVTGPAGLRYYAGYPVEAPDGTRIGALCVFGRTPRGAAEAESDVDVLRELALLAQRELWRWEPGAE